jgi:hypothetical protein
LRELYIKKRRRRKKEEGTRKKEQGRKNCLLEPTNK